MEVLYGLHPVEEALKAGRRRFDHVLVARERHDARLEQLVALCRQAGVRVRQESREQLTLVAKTPRIRASSPWSARRSSLAIEDLFEPDPAAKPGAARLLLALDGVEDPQNLGALLRVADGAGVDGVVLTERRSAPLSPVAVKASAGAAEHLRIARVVNLVRALEELKRQNLWIIGLDERGTSDYDHFDFTGDCVLVLGREGAGLHDLVRRTCDHLLRIPMAGGVSSLNVSAAGAVVLYEAFRQRRIKAGNKGVIQLHRGRRASKPRKQKGWVHEVFSRADRRCCSADCRRPLAPLCASVAQNHSLPGPHAAPCSQRPAAQRQGHLLPLHRRKRPDHHPGRPGRSQPPPDGRRAHRHATPSARPSPSPPSTWTCTCAPPSSTSPCARCSPCATTASPRSPASRCRSPLRSTGSAFACSAATPPFPWPRSTPTPTTPASCTKPPSRSPTPLAPGQSIQLDVTYSGAIAQSAQRLLAIGTPQDVALHSDWDGIGVPFTGLRGFGNVVWYPVSSVPVILGDGARLFDEMGEHKLRLAGAHFRLRLTVEFPHGHAPTVALINGHPAPLTVTDVDSLGQEIDGVATASARQLRPRL